MNYSERDVREFLTPYKGREIDSSKPVKVYRNLNAPKGETVYSVMQQGLVVAHAHSLLLRDCTFRVSKAGNERAVRESKRNVHAFAIGYLTTGAMGVGIDQAQAKLAMHVHYNPFDKPYFYLRGYPDRPLKGAWAVMLNEVGVTASYTH